jgi:hypothetical protein
MYPSGSQISKVPTTPGSFERRFESDGFDLCLKFDLSQHCGVKQKNGATSAPFLFGLA